MLAFSKLNDVLQHPPRKISLILCQPIGWLSDIKLIRTDTTLDLSQKAEKVTSQTAPTAHYIPTITHQNIMGVLCCPLLLPAPSGSASAGSDLMNGTLFFLASLADLALPSVGVLNLPAELHLYSFAALFHKLSLW